MNMRKRGSAERKSRGSATVIAMFVIAVMVAASASFFFIGGYNNNDAGASDIGVTDITGVSERTGYEVSIGGMSSTWGIENAIAQAISENPGVDIIVTGMNNMTIVDKVDNGLTIDLSDATIVWASEYISSSTVSITGPGTFILDENGSFEVMSFELVACEAELNGELRSYYGPYPYGGYVYYDINFVARMSTVTVNTQLASQGWTNITIDSSNVIVTNDQYLRRTFCYVLGTNGLLTFNGDLHFGGSDCEIMAGYVGYDDKTGEVIKVNDGGTIVINGNIFGGEITYISAIGNGSVTVNGNLRGWSGELTAGGAKGLSGRLTAVPGGTIVINGDVQWTSAFITAIETGAVTINGYVFSSGATIAAGLEGYDWWTYSNFKYSGGTIFISGSVVGSWMSETEIFAIVGGTIFINGNATARVISVGSGSTITVMGDVDVTGNYDAKLEVIDGGIFAINGTLTVPNNELIFINNGTETRLT
ncbi:MAG: hypothetical protein LBE48_04445, partial [Methanomassiliicoccaceae archaeon]|nr:hypothetical protein [Methanomassiliicoccaceae archaeon]